MGEKCPLHIENEIRQVKEARNRSMRSGWEIRVQCRLRACGRKCKNHDTGEKVFCCTVIATTPNEVMADIHD